MQAFFDYTAIEQSQQQATGAWARAIGIGSEVRLTPVAIVGVRIAKLSGASEDDRIDLSGFDTTFSLRWQY
jgi:phosphoribosylaminoimidazole (AIR) synthetase